MTPIYFASPAEWRKGLTWQHAAEAELWVGFYKRGSGHPTLTWPESVDQALCFGWIDGVRKRVDQDRYVIRLTPRKPKSTWSNVNIRRVRDLIKARRMRAAGLRAFQRRTKGKSGTYAYQQRETATLRKRDEVLLRKNPRAWKDFSSGPPWYRRLASFWVISAKQEATRQKRLRTLIECSAAGQPIGSLRRT